MKIDEHFFKKNIKTVTLQHQYFKQFLFSMQRRNALTRVI